MPPLLLHYCPFVTQCDLAPIFCFVVSPRLPSLVHRLVSRQLAETAQLSARDWKCLMMSQFELGKYADVKSTWFRSKEVCPQFVVGFPAILPLAAPNSRGSLYE